MLGVDLQDTFIFSGNVADNLKLNSNVDNIELENLNKRLSNKNFVDKAPKDIVEECRFKLNEGSLQMERITKKLKLLN